MGSVEPSRLGVSWSAIRSVLESVLGSVLENNSELTLGVYSNVFLGVS